MDFFDKIGEVAAQTYKKTTEKADKFAKETKLKMKMNENKSKIEELYKEIGAAVYRIHISRKNDNAEEQIKISCNEIDKISEEIEKANEELLKIRNKKQCGNCHEEIEITAKYCPKCGIEQEEEKPRDSVTIKEGLIIENEDKEDQQEESGEEKQENNNSEGNNETSSNKED